MNIPSLILDSDNFLSAAAGATALVALLAVWHGLLARAPITARVREIAKFSDDLKAGAMARRPSRARADFRNSGISLMHQAVSRLNLMRGRQTERIQAKLARAGWRSKEALTAYVFAKAVLPLFAVGGAALFLFLRGMAAAKGVNLILLVVGIGLGLMGVDLWVKNAGDKRVKRLTRALPDALDLLVICAEAGLGLDAAVKRVGQEMATASADMADELMLTSVELNFLPDRAVALQNLIGRTDVPKLRALVNSLIQSERFGTPLANSLRVLSAEFREERMMAAEEKAAKLPAIMTVPMIMFILPSLFTVIMGPAVIHIVDTLSSR
jgi:tight adherence protein C